MNIEKYCKQIAVYWEFKEYDGFGSASYEDPVEIRTRWSDITEVIADSTGKEVVSRTQVHTLIDLEHESYLHLGRLDDLTTDEKADPKTVDGAREVIRFTKVPSISGRVNVRKVYL